MTVTVEVRDDGVTILTQARPDETYKSEFDNALDLRVKALGIASYVLNSVGYIYDEDHNQTAVRDFDFRLGLAAQDAGQVGAVTAIMESHAALVPSANKTTILADGADTAIITLSGQTSFAYRVFFEHQVVSQGNVIDSSIQLQTDTPGQYVVELSLNNNTGYILLEAI